MEKMYILAAVCIVATVLYIAVEISEKKRKSDNDETETSKAEYA
jgi:uncharacterized membrane protein